MEDEDVEYDSDYIDEEIEARLYASVFYDDDADEPKRSTTANYEKIAVDPTLVEALYLTITGNTPNSVIQKADERVNRYVQQNGADEHPIRTYDVDTSSDSFSDDLPSKRPKLDILLGNLKQSIEDLQKPKELLFDHLEDLPTDGKYWSLDSADMPSLSRRKRQYREPDSNCERCFRKGHTWLECTSRGPLCYLCGREGHTVRDCPNKCCSICNEFGHDSSHCSNKIRIFNAICSRCKQKGHDSKICPDIWRQYKYTTQPGKPVVVIPSPVLRAKSCFNCGGRGHTGEQCRKPTVDGRSAVQTSIFKFDDCDVYAESSKNIKESSPRTRRSQKCATESTPKIRAFDEPLYCSFENGTSTQSPLLSLPRASLPKQAGWRKVRGGNKVAVNNSLRSRNKINHPKRNAKATRRQPFVDVNNRRYRNQVGNQTLRTLSSRMLKNFQNHGVLAKDRKRKHPESSVLHDSPNQEESKELNNNLIRPDKLKESQRRKPTVRSRSEKADKRSKKNGLWMAGDLPNIATSPYLKLMHTFHIDA
ncbi:Zinc finger CCHC domain-containing protein 7 [Taenia crassiceps]|uniref:Zinc finger CCHC domain-containing protein 7 n=1 Tax=Taenia crassiceps TaxID=6207 RepID=A0ABR4QF14_9CEST